MAENDLSSQLAIAATRAGIAVGGEIRESINDLRKAAPDYAVKAIEIQAKVAKYLAQGATGEIDPDMAREAASREREAFFLLAEKTREAGAQAALKRLNKGIEIATDLGITLIKIAANAPIPGV